MKSTEDEREVFGTLSDVQEGSINHYEKGNIGKGSGFVPWLQYLHGADRDGDQSQAPDTELILGPALCLAQGMYMVKETPLQLLFSWLQGPELRDQRQHEFQKRVY